MEHIRIENEHIIAEVKVAGGELCRIYSKSSQLEYMWSGNEEIWGSTSPVLFPIVGRTKHFKYTYQGLEYEIPQHGIFRRNKDCRVISQSNTHVTVGLNWNEETLIAYPFKFNFEITYRLEEKEILVEHKVENLGTDIMHYSLGAHPGFACPLHEHESYEDYYLEFETEETKNRWRVTENGTIAPKPVPYLNHEKEIPLSKDLFSEDAIVLKNLKSNTIHLKSRKSSQVLSVHFHSFPYLGLWAKPNAPFVCIEPWQGIADGEEFFGDFNEKEGIMSLDSYKTSSTSYSIEISD